MLYDIQVPGVLQGLVPALYLELAVDRVDIPLHGTHRNHQSVRNLSIGVARHNQPQHLQLAFAQRFTKRVHSRNNGSLVRHVLVMRSTKQCQEAFSIVRGAWLTTGRTMAHLHQQMRYWCSFIHKETDVALWFCK